MNIKRQFKLAMKLSSYGMIALIGLIYGMFFGGMFTIMNEGFSFMGLITETLTYGGAFTVIFMLIINLTYVTIVTKSLISLSMNRKEIRLNWMIVSSMNTIIMTTIGMLVLIVKLNLDRLNGVLAWRAFNMTFSEMTFIQWGLLLIIMILLFSMVNQGLMSICFIGNNYNVFMVIGASLSLVAVIIYNFFTIIDFVKWGDKIAGNLLVMLAFSAVFFVFNYNNILKTEVKK